MLPRWASRCSMAIPSALVVSAAVGLWLIDRADHASAVGVENDRAVHLALAGRVLGNVGQPQLIQAFPTESAVDQIDPRSNGPASLVVSALPCDPRCSIGASASRARCDQPGSRARGPARRAPVWRRSCRRRPRAPRGSHRSATHGEPCAPVAACFATRNSPRPIHQARRQVDLDG